MNVPTNRNRFHTHVGGLVLRSVAAQASRAPQQLEALRIVCHHPAWGSAALVCGKRAARLGMSGDRLEDPPSERAIREVFHAAVV